MLENLLKTIKKLPREKIIYPSILSLYFIILGVVLFFIVSLIGHEINQALNPIDANTKEQLLTSLNLKSFNQVEKKLGLELTADLATPISTTSIASSTQPASSNTTSTQNIIIATSTDQQLAGTTTVENINFKISIINSTSKIGLASKLRSEFINQGFSIEKISNQSTLENQTLIKIKAGIDQNGTQLEKIKNIVSGFYNFKIVELAANDQSDIVIIIGKN